MARLGAAGRPSQTLPGCRQSSGTAAQVWAQKKPLSWKSIPPAELQAQSKGQSQSWVGQERCRLGKAPCNEIEDMAKKFAEGALQPRFTSDAHPGMYWAQPPDIDAKGVRVEFMTGTGLKVTTKSVCGGLLRFVGVV